MRSRNSLMRERQEAFRDARLIVIASEGKDTERIYFKALAKEYTNPRVHVEKAIARAKVLDKNPSDRWPQSLGTRVYLLAESVMNRK
ncbi:MAG: hypothetical protein II834_09580 [Bacteroidaceae bacterium]|jgi:hypothetical protein|nr:hypothetical protein [Bacteroidaceae bacterium]